MAGFLFQLKNTVDENGENHVKEEQLSSSNAHEDSSTPTRNTTDSEETESNCENVSIDLDNVIVRNAPRFTFLI